MGLYRLHSFGDIANRFTGEYYCSAYFEKEEKSYLEMFLILLRKIFFYRRENEKMRLRRERVPPNPIKGELSSERSFFINGLYYSIVGIKIS